MSIQVVTKRKGRTWRTEAVGCGVLKADMKGGDWRLEVVSCVLIYRGVSNGSPSFFFHLDPQRTLMLQGTDLLPQVFVGEHGSHGGRDGPEQIDADPGVKRTPSLFLEDCLERAHHSIIAWAARHSV